MNVKSELIQSGAGNYEKIVAAKEGTALATIVLEGKECKLIKENKVTGSVAAEISPEVNASRTLTTSEKFSQKIAEEGGKFELKFDGFPAYFTGEFVMKLSGAHSAAAQFFRIEPTTLCEVMPVQRKCPATKLWLENTFVWMKGQGAMKFAVGLATFECTGSLIEGLTHHDEGEPLYGVAENVTFTGCTGGCQMKAREASYPFEMSFAERSRGGGAFIFYRPELEAVCAGGTCLYGVQDILFGTIDGSDPAKFLSRAVELSKEEPGSAAGCAATAKWYGPSGPGSEITYVGESPKPLFVTEV